MKHLKLWAVFIFTFVGASQSWGQAKTGVNTKNPKATLDVNGDVRLRYLATKPWSRGDRNPDFNVMVIDPNATGDNVGVLQSAKAIDVVFSSGLFVKQSSANTWNNVFVGPKASRLDFVGEATMGATKRYFSFSVFYNNGTGFMALPAFSKAVGGSVAVSAAGTTTFTVTVDTQPFQFTITAGSIANISTSNVSGYTLMGTFCSSPIHH